MPAAPAKISGRMTWGQKARQRIDSTLIVNKLQAFVNGDVGEDGRPVEMTQTQVNAARILLDRTLPAIKPIEVQQGGDRNAKTITNDELFSVIEGQAKRIS